MTIIFIALMHAIVVFMIAVWTESMIALITATVIAGYIGVVAGNPTYMAADLIGVGIAFWLGVVFIKSQKQKAKPPTPSPPVNQPKDALGTFLGLLCIFVIIGGLFLPNEPNQKPVDLPPQIPIAQESQRTISPQKTTQPKSAKQQSNSKKIVNVSSQPNSASSDCFNLQTDAEILECLN